jgi:peptidoglycan/xylan/chitin deacetylase (PgdA/CDA1 family)
MFSNLLNRIRKIRQPKAVILMYHQVCERRDDPWELAVNPDHFHAQLEYLKKNFDVVPMSELADGISRHKMRRAVAITFDDGFKDNYTNAAPLLDWHELPATFYVATSAMKQEYVYWWDALQDVIFHSEELPERLDMNIHNNQVQFTFRSDRFLSPKLRNQINAWNYNLAIPNERIALYMLLWHHIKPMNYASQNRILADIREWAGHERFISSQGMTMTVREMQMLDGNPLFAIGAHTVHHSMLSQQNAIDQAYEVKESKQQIEKWLGKTVNGFAYPYGNYNELTQSLLREAGFRYAVSTEPKAVTAEDDPYALPRLQVKNWCVYEFAAKLNEMVNE